MRYFVLTVVSVFVLTSCDKPDFRDLPMSDMDHTGEPSLSVAADGSVLLTYFREVDGSAELNLRELSESGWSEPKIVVRGDDLLVNWADFPSVIKSDDEKLIAQWMVRQSGPGFAYDVYVASSVDGGETWSQPARLHSDRSATEHGFVSLYSDDRGAGAFWLDGRRYASDADDRGMELPDYPDSGAFESLDLDLLNSLYALPQRILIDNQQLTFHFDILGTEDALEYVPGLASDLGLEALNIADQLRTTYKLGTRDLSSQNYDIRENLRSAASDVDRVHKK